MRRIGQLLVGAILCASVLGGCGGSPERQTPAEWVRENTLILSQLTSYREAERQRGGRVQERQVASVSAERSAS